MKGMPLSIEFEGKGVLDLELIVQNQGFFGGSGVCCVDLSDRNCLFGEPTSVLDSVRPTSSSTLSSSHGGGAGGGGGGAVCRAGSTDTASVAPISEANRNCKWQQDSTTATSSNVGRIDSGFLEIGGAAGGNLEKFAMEDWESVLSESAAVSPTQEHDILRWIMGDVEESLLGNQNNGGGGGVFPAGEFEFGGADQGFGGENRLTTTSFIPTLPIFPSNSRSSSDKLGLPGNFKFSPSSQSNVHPCTNSGSISFQHQTSFDDIKPPLFNSSLLTSQSSQNPPLFSLSYSDEQHQSILNLPPPKRHNSGGPDYGTGQIPKGSFVDSRQQEIYMGGQSLNLQQQFPHQFQHLLPQYLQQRPIQQEEKPKLGTGDELVSSHHQQQQAMVDQLYKAAELAQTGNLVLANEILARLNHQLSPNGKPFQRVAFYCKEALQLLLHCTSNNFDDPSSSSSSPINLVFKLAAYKSFLETSPLVQFANFTCNQAVLEALEGFDRIHIVDFDIGYGGQWASFLQELAVRSGGTPSLKITAMVLSPSAHNQLELGLTRENLIQFANEINISLEFEVMSIDSFSSGSSLLPQNEAVAVNLPVGSLSDYQFSAPLVLQFVKQLAPKIVVSADRGCHRMDLSFANHVIHALQSYSNLLESLDAIHAQTDALQKIEKLLLQPGIERIVTSRFRSPEKTQHWRSLVLSAGFSPVAFSNLAESQAECIIKRFPVRGFQIEKRQSSLVLCWQRKELISASAWRC